MQQEIFCLSNTTNYTIIMIPTDDTTLKAKRKTQRFDNQFSEAFLMQSPNATNQQLLTNCYQEDSVRIESDGRKTLE